SYRPASARSSPGLGILNRLFLAVERRPIKVFETLLLSLSFYLGKTGRASWSGLALGLAFFDPRLAVVALPLFLIYNKIRIMPAIRALLGILALSNLPLLYPEMGSSFLKMVFSTGITTALYPYTVIPLAEVVFLSFINYHQIRIEASRIFRRMRSERIQGKDWLPFHQ